MRTTFGTMAASVSIPAREPISNPSKTEAEYIVVIIISAVICFRYAKIKRGATRTKDISVESAMTCPTVGEANFHPISFLANVEIEQSVVPPKLLEIEQKVLSHLKLLPRTN